jgi:probable HAF family extracellular repeat protein
VTLAAAFALAALTAGVSGAVGASGAAAPALAAKLASTARPGSSVPGFLLERGRFLPVAIPRGLEDLAPGGISPIKINDRGQIVGSYLSPAGAERGFLLLDRNRNRFTTADVPRAMGTQAQGINNRGQIVGVYSDTSNPSVTGAQLRGFLLDAGRYIRLDFPGATSSQAYDINDQGQVVGEYQAADGTFHGYLWHRGRFRTLPTGGATGINNHGQITGTIGDTATPDGFVLTGNRVTTFEAPGAPVTFPFDINDRGQVVGLSTSARPPRRPPGSCAAMAGSPRSTGPAPPSPRRSASTTAARSSVSARPPWTWPASRGPPRRPDGPGHDIGGQACRRRPCGRCGRGRGCRRCSATLAERCFSLCART